MENLLERWDVAAWGELNEENMRRKLAAEGYSVSRYAYPPGTLFPQHTHHFDKKDAVLSGQFLITTPTAEFLLRGGDILSVPANLPHSARVIGNETVISLDASR